MSVHYGDYSIKIEAGKDENKEIKPTDERFEGVLKAPSDINEYCELFNTRCVNDCYGFGYCTKDRACIFTTKMTFLGKCQPDTYLSKQGDFKEKDCKVCNGVGDLKVGKSDGTGFCYCKPNYQGNDCIDCSPGYANNGEKCVKCTDNCHRCLSLSSCKICSNNYYLLGGKCVRCDGVVEEKQGNSDGTGVCLTCPSKCSECIKSDQTCKKCKSNYYLNDKRTQCVACNEKNYYKEVTNSIGFCKKCQNNCLDCTKKDTCNTCNSGYYKLEVSGGKVFCDKCDLYAGKYRYGSYCYNCKDSNCKECKKSKNYCQKCNSGFSLNIYNDICEVCTDRVGYYIYSVYCKKCMTNCDKCTRKINCHKCSKGYGLNRVSPTKCLKCEDSNCEECYESMDTCTKCKINFDLDKGVCNECKIKQCKSCSNDKNICLACKSGFKLYNNRCIECNIDNCEYCTQNGICSSCNEKFILTNNNKCQGCGNYCNKCITSSKCDTCEDRTILRIQSDSSRICSKSNYACSLSNCAECSSISNKKCLKCQKGYILTKKIGLCESCPDNCEKCNDNGVCLKCFEENGYQVDKTTGKCKLCQDCSIPCIKNCKQCSSSLICKQCLNGFFLKDNGCVYCQDNCETCKNSKECSICQSGYYRNNENDCVACKKGCKICKNGNNCDDCLSGFILNKDGSCHVENCQKGYYIAKTECLKCKSPCDDCFKNNENEIKCSKCLSAEYFLRNGDCIGFYYKKKFIFLKFIYKKKN